MSEQTLDAGYLEQAYQAATNGYQGLNEKNVRKLIVLAAREACSGRGFSDEQILLAARGVLRKRVFDTAGHATTCIRYMVKSPAYAAGVLRNWRAQISGVCL